MPRRFSDPSVESHWPKLPSSPLPNPRRGSISRSVSHNAHGKSHASTSARVHGGLPSLTSVVGHHSRRGSIDKSALEPSPILSNIVPKTEEWSPPISPSTPPVKAYASLPPSPLPSLSATGVKTSPFDDALPETPTEDKVDRSHALEELAPFSLWEYLREELLATDFDSHQELKWERVSNFFNIPVGVEKVLSFGFVLCLDSFLYLFTILPIRFTIAVYSAIISTIFRSKGPLPPSQKADILRMTILVVSIAILIPMTDASKIYHSIRGQDTIKLYVIFNALEIADRLLISIGQDILDCMFSRSTLLVLSNHIAPTTHTLRPVLYFILSIVYTVSHGLILVYQLTALNVAINAYDNALLTLLLSNQFVEIKGSVFKKFEKDNLFQITCADIVERFQLALMLGSIAMRNLIELSSSELDLSSETYALPVAYKAFRFLSEKNIIGSILAPVLTVLASELAVDWLKHAFITKFNHIRPSVYERYIDILCRDLTTETWVGKRRMFRKHTYVDQSPVVARRLGLASLPLATLAVIISLQSLSLVIETHFSQSFSFDPSQFDLEYLLSTDWVQTGKWIALGFLLWACAVIVKLIIGANLLGYSTRRRDGMEERMRQDEEINDFFRPPIGEGKEERAYNKELKSVLNQVRDTVPPTSEMGENPVKKEDDGKARGGGGGGGRKKVKLEDLTRFTMVKRIW
ncbi:hypothetical protein FRC02_003227 [Tulasnella sp. 418]|nr:hypothetical protein FRC02_003227 [Tulasnella sp. 418]